MMIILMAVLFLPAFHATPVLQAGETLGSNTAFLLDTEGNKAIDIRDGNSGGPTAVKENGEYILYGIVNFSSPESAQPGEPAPPEETTNIILVDH